MNVLEDLRNDALQCENYNRDLSSVTGPAPTLHSIFKYSSIINQVQGSREAAKISVIIKHCSLSSSSAPPSGEYCDKWVRSD